MSHRVGSIVVARLFASRIRREGEVIAPGESYARVMSVEGDTATVSVGGAPVPGVTARAARKEVGA